ncbi:BT_2262 family domain-containing protein [Saccharicrinis aurantiacus]|uniref:BT_2262 family domain-containing protein n=1 Tax=Saccharicrinis aurantiacus TaxID=1849719 RepID=UPI00248F5702|nr:BT_2262 family domain-containing protein [Saccharicrinis aurantiacus]
MKINIFKYIAFIFAVLVFASCAEKETEGISDITYYVTIVLEGDEIVYHEKDTPWVEPGYSATEGEDDVTDAVIATEPDVSVLGSNTLSYSATNSDGYSGAVSREVIVHSSGLSSVDISGEYTGDVFRLNTDDNSSVSFAGNPVVISKTSVEGLYMISDWIAGFYAVGYGYGAGYAFPGYLQMISDTEFEHVSMSNAWGDPFDSVESVIVDASTGSITYTAKWLGKYNFDISLQKD